MVEKTTSSSTNASAAAGDASSSGRGATSRKKTAGKSKKPSAKSTHPRTAEMVNEAIETLREKQGSSFQAIKKYIGNNYKLDAEKHAPFIKKYLKAAVTSGSLVQTRGKGASGSFKLATIKSDLTIKSNRIRSQVERAKSKTPVKIAKKASGKQPLTKATVTKAKPTKKKSAPATKKKNPDVKASKARPTTVKSKTTKTPAKKATPGKKSVPKKGSSKK